MEEERGKVVTEEIKTPNVVITKVDSSSSDLEDDRGSVEYNGSLVESHSENEFTKASTSPYQPPNDDTKQKIRKQVEFYMSDENLAKDAFLLKHVRRHKEGYVNLKLITSFKKVKTLTKDYRVVAESLAESTVLAMNSECTKVRRVSPLPTELGERNPSRTIVATQLAITEPTIEKVAEIFSKFGPIAVVRIIRGAKNTPAEYKTHFQQHPELSDETCAIVEFETMAAAARACSELKNGEMKVTELIRSNKNRIKKENIASGGDSEIKDSDNDSEKKERKKRKKKKGAQLDKRLSDLVKSSGDEGHSSSSDNENSFSSFNSYRRRYNSGSADAQSPKVWRNNKASGRNSASPVTSPETRRRTPDLWRQSPGHSSDSSTPRSPILQRRLAGQSTSPLAANADHRMIQSLGVLRQPRGPDGTRGFGVGRGRIVGVSA